MAGAPAPEFFPCLQRNFFLRRPKVPEISAETLAKTALGFLPQRNFAAEKTGLAEELQGNLQRKISAVSTVAEKLVF